MTKRHSSLVLATLLALIVFAGVLAGCTQQAQQSGTNVEATEVEGAGTLILKVNPGFKIVYDEEGNVVEVAPSNDDAKGLELDLSSYEGKPCREVVAALVAGIKDAGFLVDAETGEGRTIQLEVEDGSSLPSNDFLRNIVYDTESYVVGQSIKAPMEVKGSSNYGWTDYTDTDYGPDNDGVTDYYDTDYGPLNDGATDYSAPAASGSGGGSTGGGGGYDNTGYDNTGYDNTGYSSGSGGGSASASTAKPAGGGGSSSGGGSAPAPAPSGGGNSGYDNSNYGGNSGYDNSGYGDDSGYDD